MCVHLRSVGLVLRTRFGRGVTPGLRTAFPSQLPQPADLALQSGNGSNSNVVHLRPPPGLASATSAIVVAPQHRLTASTASLHTGPFAARRCPSSPSSSSTTSSTVSARARGRSCSPLHAALGLRIPARRSVRKGPRGLHGDVARPAIHRSALARVGRGAQFGQGTDRIGRFRGETST